MVSVSIIALLLISLPLKLLVLFISHDEEQFNLNIEDLTMVVYFVIMKLFILRTINRNTV